MSGERNPDMVNEWTRDDLPEVPALRQADDERGTGNRSTAFDIALDVVVDHLNRAHPKPAPGLLSSAADCVLDAEDRVRSVKADADRLRRAHEIVERERDQARLQRDEARHKVAALVHDIEWHQRRMGEHCDDVDAAEADRDEWKARAEAAEGERDHARATVASLCERLAEYSARAEAAEARTAVTREDVEKVVHGSGGGFFDSRLDAIADAVCDLLGVEAEQDTDPVLDKALEFAGLVDWELTDREAGLLHTVARHVIGQEADR